MQDYSAMHPKLEQARIFNGGQEIESAPRAPGVYRFYNNDEALLYIGKSIDIGNRLRSHFGDARAPGRQQSMMSAVRRIDCELTAGELGALLLENAAIKAEKPLYNRRQRRLRALWTLRLEENVDGFLTLVPSNFSPGGERLESVYGLYRSPKHIDTALRSRVRDNGLCLRVLGLERGRGPCFQHQLGRCRGACAGKDSAAAHNARLLNAIADQRIAAWPFPGPVLLHEERDHGAPVSQPRRQFHLLHHWAYLGSFNTRRGALKAASAGSRGSFDRDAYRIALAALRKGQCEPLDALTGEALENRLLRPALLSSYTATTATTATTST